MSTAADEILVVMVRRWWRADPLHLPHSPLASAGLDKVITAMFSMAGHMSIIWRCMLAPPMTDDMTYKLTSEIMIATA